MFTGSVPKPVVEQILRITPFADWRNVYVCCSGSFRVDRALRDRFDNKVCIHSNDVSLLSVGLGRLAVGDDMTLSFTGRLSFIEDFLGDADLPQRLAAVLVALDMGAYAGKSEHAHSHFRHYQANFDTFFDKARILVDRFRDETKIDSFFAGDFREHAMRAKDGGGVVAFPPTYKGGYERLYRFLDENVIWEPPAYDMWNPKDLPGWLDSMDSEGIPFCVFYDQPIEGRERIAEYYSNTNKPIYIYASQNTGTSLRRAGHNSRPFRYQPIDPSRLRADCRIQVIKADSAQMNFLKDIYLAKGIHHASGMFNFLVYVDDMLAGGFILDRSKFGGISELYMLSDFSITRERRVSKLIPMLAASRDVIRVVEKRLLSRIDTIYTTAFTDKPVSMKYRGIYELAKRGDGFLNYSSAIRQQSPEQVYAEWWKKHGSKV